MYKSLSQADLQRIKDDFENLMSHLRAQKLSPSKNQENPEYPDMPRQGRYKSSDGKQSPSTERSPSERAALESTTQRNSPWKRTKIVNEPFKSTPYFYTGDVNALELRHKVNLLPRSYRDVRLDGDQRPKPFRNTTIHTREFKDPPESYLTKIGKMSLKRRKDSFEEKQNRKRQEEEAYFTNRRKLFENNFQNTQRGGILTRAEIEYYSRFEPELVGCLDETGGLYGGGASGFRNAKHGAVQPAAARTTGE